MADIHLIDAEKGGVGKSVVARTMLQLFLDRQIAVVPMEADRSNPTLSNIYGDQVKVAIFSEDRQFEDAPDMVFELALTQPVILDLPAQIHRPIAQWIHTKGLLELGEQHQVRFLKWFICDGGNDSINLFLKSVDHYKHKVPHVLVKNKGRCDNWSILDAYPQVKATVKKYQIPVIEFPRFSSFLLSTIDTQRLTFDAARQHPDLGLIGRNQVVTFLKDAYAALDIPGWLPSASKSTSTKNSIEAVL
jgi:hypothetical protein